MKHLRHTLGRYFVIVVGVVLGAIAGSLVAFAGWGGADIPGLIFGVCGAILGAAIALRTTTGPNGTLRILGALILATAAGVAVNACMVVILVLLFWGDVFRDFYFAVVIFSIVLCGGVCGLLGGAAGFCTRRFQSHNGLTPSVIGGVLVNAVFPVIGFGIAICELTTGDTPWLNNLLVMLHLLFATILPGALGGMIGGWSARVSSSPVEHIQVRPTSGKRSYLFWTSIALIVGCGVTVAVAARFESRRRYLNDQRIVSEVERTLTSTLRSLDQTHPISQRFGAFIKLTDVHWNRPGYAWQLVERLDLSATAHFEKAQASISLGIDRGEALVIMPLEMTPWIEASTGKTRWTISGWAKHPEFVYDR